MSEGGEMRSFDDYDDDQNDDWVPKEPMIKFKDLEDEEGSDREVNFWSVQQNETSYLPIQQLTISK